LFIQDNLLFVYERNLMAFVGHLILLQLSKGGLWAERAGEEASTWFFGFAVFSCCRLLTVGCRVMVSVVSYNYR
jgi:hypothetical protein